MPVKYKGELDMYFVKGIIPELCDEQGFPNSRFRFKMQLIKLQDVEETVNKMFIDEAHPNLWFHNAQLAMSIVSQAELLATAERLPVEEYVNLKLASVFLVTGYMSDYNDPAEASFKLLDEMLPRFGFDESYIISARNIIANSFNEKYESDTEKILHDARYDYLGRVDYLKLSDKLLRERNEHGIITSPDAWRDIQKKFLKDHEFLTKTGKLLRSVPLEEQIAKLQALHK
jgi:hypothetical protein